MGVPSADGTYVIDLSYIKPSLRSGPRFGTHTLDQDELGSIDQLDQPC